MKILNSASYLAQLTGPRSYGPFGIGSGSLMMQPPQNMIIPNHSFASAEHQSSSEKAHRYNQMMIRRKEQQLQSSQAQDEFLRPSQLQPQ